MSPVRCSLLVSMLVGAQCSTLGGGQVSEHTIAPEPIPTVYNVSRVKIAKSEWTNRGLRTPGDAIQTWLWTMREADTNALLACICPREERLDPKQSLPYFLYIAGKMQEQMSSTESYKPTALERIDEATVGVTIRVYGGGCAILRVDMRDYRGEWKIVAIHTFCTNTCLNIMRQIHGATQQLAIERGLSWDYVPRKDELRPYLKKDPNEMLCPDAGQYELGSANTALTCSIH